MLLRQGPHRMLHADACAVAFSPAVGAVALRGFRDMPPAQSQCRQYIQLSGLPVLTSNIYQECGLLPAGPHPDVSGHGSPHRGRQVSRRV